MSKKKKVDDERAREELRHGSKSYAAPMHSAMSDNEDDDSNGEDDGDEDDR